MKIGDKIFLTNTDCSVNTDELFYITKVNMTVDGNHIIMAQSAKGGKSFALRKDEFVILKGPSEREIDKAFDDFIMSKSKFKKSIDTAFWSGVEFCAIYLNK